jgi:hypothetical protein
MTPHSHASPVMPLLVYTLTKTTRRLTFDILSQLSSVTYVGDDDGAYFKFTASNGYEVISRSRMDIQTERLWLLGSRRSEEARSGSMVFSSDEKRDEAYTNFVIAIDEWAAHHGGYALQERTRPRSHAQDWRHNECGEVQQVTAQPAAVVGACQKEVSCIAHSLLEDNERLRAALVAIRPYLQKVDASQNERDSLVIIADHAISLTGAQP